MVVGIAFLALILLIVSLSFPSSPTGNAVSSGSSGNNDLVSHPVAQTGACSRAPFDQDPGAKKCGKGCCFATQTCFRGNVCCGPDEVGDGFPGIITYCVKKCDLSKGQTQCGEVCCGKDEICRKQGLDLPGLDPKEHGVCFKPDQINGCNAAKGETACPTQGETKECCAANQVCKVKKVGLSFPPIKIPIWGCSVDLKKNGGCGANTFCQGIGNDFKEHAICCKNPGESCALYPNGQPYCYVFPEKKVAAAGSGFFDRMRSFFGWS